jgi:catechol 2,3-dioxygenase-like lactoylglutathione lyase family enzyme
MLTALDHIIIGVNNLEQATHIFEDHLGLLTSGGGKHPSGGTANRIIVIGDTYLELITIDDREEAQPSLLSRLAKGDGYLNFVLASNTIETDSQAMAQRGIPVIGPNKGELRSTNGISRSWLRTDVERPELAQRYPFIIQHDSSGEERRIRLAGGSIPPAHPLDTIGVISTTLAVADLDEATQRFQQIYGLQPSTASLDTSWNAQIVTFPLSDRTQSFELAKPLTMDISQQQPEQLTPERQLSSHLHYLGESLCRITLAVENLQTAQCYLDEHKVDYLRKDQPHPTVWINPDRACGAVIVLQET